MVAYRVWQISVLRDAPLLFDHKEQSSTSCSSANCSVVFVVSLLVSLMIDQVKVDESDKLRLPYLVGHDGVPKELQAAEKGLHGCKFSQLSQSNFCC